MSSSFHWLPTGDLAFAAMLETIQSAQQSVRLEMYIYHDCPIGNRFRVALTEAVRRGVRVQVMLDGVGSLNLSDSFWGEFQNSGGQLRWFNRDSIIRVGTRDHRKILVCDDAISFVGGLNIATEYEGDGVTRGWYDLGMKICGEFSLHLAAAFDHLFATAEERLKTLARWRKKISPLRVGTTPEAELLLSKPGNLRNPLKRALRRDFGNAKKVQLLCAYFFPTRRILAALRRIAQNGGKVQLILAGKSDVALSQMAARSLY
ncbi:MAG: phospholipase D-like domain-containing protein, partial [Verrucomicrobiota bacterium]